jgi:bacteriocin-like protein
MPDPKSQKPSTPDTLTKAGKGASIELSENELNKVAGGKAKTADKAFQAMDAYIRG